MKTETNIGHEFLNLNTKHFFKHHWLHKICNKNSIKISYCCMPNISAVISNHNKKLLSTLPKVNRLTTAHPQCNCWIKTPCPLNGECKQKSVVYKAGTSSNSTTKLYFGSCSTDFRTRYSNHKHSFTHRNRRIAIELSKEIWQAKDNGIELSIKWSLFLQHHPNFVEAVDATCTRLKNLLS